VDYSQSVLSKLLKAFMRYRRNICYRQMNEQDNPKT